jgi:transposase
LKPWRVKQWCIPPQGNAAFVAAMEDVLEVYRRAYDPTHPLVCMDEKAVQLVGETRQPLLVKAGREARSDFEYVRRGVTNLFIFFEPLAAKRQVAIRERRGARQWAEVMRELVDVHYPQAERITVVLDNLNTHALSSLYQVYEPKEARRIARKLEMHYTPKHGSWLNMAEIELSVLARQCLKRRLASEEELGQEVMAWTKARNGSEATVDWRFTTDDARIKLKRLYPIIADVSVN